MDWISSCPDGTSSVVYADNPAHANASTALAVDHASAYEDLKMLHTNYTLHYALMTDLKPGAQIFYKLGCKTFMGYPLSFQAFPPVDREPIWCAPPPLFFAPRRQRQRHVVQGNERYRSVRSCRIHAPNLGNLQPRI